jgi:hypothetical protein
MAELSLAELGSNATHSFSRQVAGAIVLVGHHSRARAGQKGLFMSTLNQSLERLRSLAPEVNKAANSAAKIVEQVESLLTNELSLGVRAEVTVSSQNISKTKSEYTSLSYRRIKGKYRIAVVTGLFTEFADSNNIHDQAWETMSETPWAECSRDVKLESFPKLPELLRAIIAEAERVQKKAFETEQVLTAILGKSPKEEMPK